MQSQHEPLSPLVKEDKVFPPNPMREGDNKALGVGYLVGDIHCSFSSVSAFNCFCLVVMVMSYRWVTWAEIGRGTWAQIG